MRNERLPTSSITGKPVTDEDVYTMLMLYRGQRQSIEKIARRYGVDPGQVRRLLGRRLSSNCCG